MIDTFLKPYECEFPKIRIGSDRDGGYVIIDNDISTYTGLIGMGINDDNKFEKDFQEKSGCYVQQYDYSIDEPPSDIPNSDFFKTKVESSDDLVPDTRLGSRQFLKIDIEGSEWDLLNTMNLESYEQIAIELHFTMNARNVLDSLAHLTKHHTVVHVHGNSCVKTPITYINSYNRFAWMPPAIELTLLRNDLSKFSPNETWYPMHLDQSCDFGSTPDIDMRFHPFVPEFKEEKTI